MKPIEILRAHGVPDSTIKKFLAYHAAHPGIWQAFEAGCLQVARKGKRFGFKAVMEHVRWSVEIEGTEIDGQRTFKVDNDFTAYYGRIFIAKYPDLREQFEIRSLKGLAA